MSTIARIIPLVMLVAVASAALSGCVPAAGPEADAAPTSDTTTAPQPLTADELAAWQARADANPHGLGPGEGELEYAEAVREFPLAMPEGTAFPKTTAFSFYAADGLLDRGAGNGLASWTWLCATETELLDALDAGDNARSATSFDALEAWMSLPAEVRMLEGLDSFRSVVIEPARAGDTTGLEADRVSWCAQAPFDPA
jgi:hypothetical protein